ncbi:MAG: hypothetical protein R3E01_31505 [Pirellulaceae bacterium]
MSRKINRDDDNYGTYWSGAFKMDELPDDGAILMCGVYIDLNWIAAQMAQTPEESTDTSIGHLTSHCGAKAEQRGGETVTVCVASPTPPCPSITRTGNTWLVGVTCSG